MDKTKKICENCKWWYKYKLDNQIAGTCQNSNWFINEPKDLTFYTSDDMKRIEICGYVVDIYPEFGCIHWENNEQKNKSTYPL